MSSFYDLLEDVDGKLNSILGPNWMGLLERLDFDWKYPTKEESDRTDYKVEFEAEPAKHLVSDQANICINLSNQHYRSWIKEVAVEREWKSTPTDSGLDLSDETQAMIKVDHDGCTNTIKFSDSRMLFKAKGTLLEDKDWKVEMGLLAEQAPSDKEYRFKG